MSTEYSDDRPIKADCGHYVADHAELVEQRDGTRICMDCDEERRQNGDA
jgi:hypothetical protein